MAPKLDEISEVDEQDEDNEDYHLIKQVEKTLTL